MSQVITTAFENYWQTCMTDGQPVVLDEFVLANIPGLDITSPINPATGLPQADQIVYRQAVDQRGRVNNNAVAYSIVMDTSVGNFTFNAMYLINKASGVVGMIVYKGSETKTKTDTATGTTGNSLVKSMLMEYDQAATATVTTVAAGTWQIDYSARLNGMEEQQRLAALALFGSAAFFGTGFQVLNKSGVYKVQPGVGMVGGLRVQLDAEQAVTISAKPMGVWLDVYRAGTILSSWDNHITISTSAAELTNYTDANGYHHYVAKIGTVGADNAVTDTREVSSSADIWGSLKALKQADITISSALTQAVNDLTSALQNHEQGRNHPDASETAKGFVEIANQTETSEATSAVLAVPPKYLPEAIAKYAPVASGYRNLKLSADGVSANVMITADQLVLDAVSGPGALLAKNVAVTAVASASGLNGLDAGSLAASTWYSVWVVSNGTTVASLLSLSATTPTMPNGYTHRRRVGWIRTDQSANKYPLAIKSTGATFEYVLNGANVPRIPAMASGVQGSPTTPAWIAVGIAAFVPATAAKIKMVLTNPGSGTIAIASPSNKYGYAGSNPPLAETSPSAAGFGTGVSPFDVIVESNSVFYASNGASASLSCVGWEDAL